MTNPAETNPAETNPADRIIEANREILRGKLEELRRKVIDLSNRNPLIKTPLSSRASIVRAVDEMPEALAEKLRDQRQMTFVPLPPMEDEPRDEKTEKFREALKKFKAEDEEYLSQISEGSLDEEADEGKNLESLERKVRDKVRAELGLPPRPAKNAVSAEEHARSLGIDPSYELPTPTEQRQKKHEDFNIQTLLFRADLELKLSALMSKCRTWEEETGINVLQAGFGLLKWTDQDSAKKTEICSPLILLPVRLIRKKTVSGVKFQVYAYGEDASANFVLSEKLKTAYGLNLPEFDPEGSVEEYFRRVAELETDLASWQVLRQAYFGVFPSASLAIYRDLHPDKSWYSANRIITDLLCGRQAESAAPEKPPLDVDDPEVEAKIHPLVLSADSSQARVIYDVLQGEDLALQGPPGTGKSQTIVNAIAAALGKGLKVLFVAEKLAALEVVKSRLEAVGVGDYLLALQGNRSERAEVIKSLSSRVAVLDAPLAPLTEPPFATQDKFYEAKKLLAEYLTAVNSRFGASHLTMRDVLGRYLSTQSILAELPRSLQNVEIPALEKLDEAKTAKILAACADLEKAAEKAKDLASPWRTVSLSALDADKALEILSLTKHLSETFAAGDGADEELGRLGLAEPNPSLLNEARTRLNALLDLGPIQAGLVRALAEPEQKRKINAFLAEAAKQAEAEKKLSSLFASPLGPAIVDKLKSAVQLAEEAKLPSLEAGALGRACAEETASVRRLNDLLTLTAPLTRACPELLDRPLKDLAKAAKLVQAQTPAVFELRPFAPKEPTALLSFQSVCDRGLALQNSFRQLQTLFDLSGADPLPSPPEIRALCAQLKESGFFQRFGRSFREAKAKCLKISLRPKFDRLQAAQDLQLLADHRQAAAPFEEEIRRAPEWAVHVNKIASAVGLALGQAPALGTGGNVGGGNSAGFDFALFKQTADYANETLLLFPRPEDQALRALLLEGEAELLASLPLDGPPDVPSLGQAAEELPRRQARAANLKGVVAKIGELLGLADLAGLDVADSAKAIGASPKSPLVVADSVETNKILALFRSGESPASPAPNYPQTAAVGQLADLAAEILAKRAELDNSPEAAAWLGEKFQGGQTTRESLASEFDCLAILDEAPALRQNLLAWLDSGQLLNVQNLIAKHFQLESQADELADSLSLKSGLALETLLSAKTKKQKADFLRELSQDEKGLYAFGELNARRQALGDLDFGFLAEALEKENSPLRHLSQTAEALIYRGLIGQIKNLPLVRNWGDYSSETLDGLRETLAQADRDLTAYARATITEKLSDARPPIGVGTGRKKDFTELSLIRNEINKQRQFIPIRQLIMKACQSLQELKPCWMMSPTAVSQYLADETISFDLAILDEASQMPPEKAIPALARCRQVMIVGDTNQLPPTTFFRYNLKIDEETGDEENEGVVEESILELARKVYAPERSLTWHYRSRNSSLINYSNEVIYGNTLIVYPSPMEKRADMGVELIKLDGLYKKGLNKIEAQAMVDKALEHMRVFPDRSLGLVALNQKQSDYLNELMRLAVENDPAADDYVEKWRVSHDGLESFFVKNLENVQGDERDVIYISTVYGPETPNGPVALRFGPIIGPAGRNRLNVLFSRAKQKIITFTSLKSSDLGRASESQAGLIMLRGWLEYCETLGRRQDIGSDRSPAPLSFEEYVQGKIRALNGGECDYLAGTEGFKLDLAVKAEADSLGYYLGLSSDSPGFYQKISCRDRDRLRPEVLQGLGWSLGQLWSYSWFLNPVRESELLAQTIEKARRAESEAAKSRSAGAAVSKGAAEKGPAEKDAAEN
ncbi:MAG: DUF4011 domain-containing protein [Deltaproteobacteria bacterium]|jgi:hypothetical protein|nr:DUF4011 domain-containing protein [Deltaproteobacteria bacterium]